jgi:hypothetical protein
MKSPNNGLFFVLLSETKPDIYTGGKIMADAKRCDICKEYYSPYNTKDDVQNPNGLIFISNDKTGYYGYGKTECCPRCMRSLKSHIDILKQRGE